MQFQPGRAFSTGRGFEQPERHVEPEAPTTSVMAVDPTHGIFHFQPGRAFSTGRGFASVAAAPLPVSVLQVTEEDEENE